MIKHQLTNKIFPGISSPYLQTKKTTHQAMSMGQMFLKKNNKT